MTVDRPTTATCVPFQTIVRRQKQGRPQALAAACTASPLAIRAVLGNAREAREPVLIESTAGQVNLSGGYSGLSPSRFRDRVFRMAAEIGIAPERIILGGDHIGPHPWKHETAENALRKSKALAVACVAAGYRKLHLDTATPCRDDRRRSDGTLPLETVSRRAAGLCGVAENAVCRVGGAPPWYVIGSDVPPPGGGMSEAPVPLSDAQGISDAVAAHRRAFCEAGLADAWQRVFALVVYTGADFSPTAVQPYDSGRVQPLVAAIRQESRLVFEAHSTDFQPAEALSSMVRDHCGILKVGPALTFAMREALFALAAVEQAFLGARKGVRLSRLPEVMEELMTAEPGFWASYYQGTEAVQARLRRQGYSDRIRYYWFHPQAAAAVKRLMANLRRYPPPEGLIETQFPEVAAKLRDGRLSRDPEKIVLERIARVAATYARACRFSQD